MSAPRQKRTCVAQNSVPQNGQQSRGPPNTWAHGAEVKTARCRTLARGGSFDDGPRLHGVRRGPLRVPSGEFFFATRARIAPGGSRTMDAGPAWSALQPVQTAAPATLAPSKGRLMRCTVPGSTPNRL